VPSIRKPPSGNIRGRTLLHRAVSWFGADDLKETPSIFTDDGRMRQDAKFSRGLPGPGSQSGLRTGRVIAPWTAAKPGASTGRSISRGKPRNRHERFPPTTAGDHLARTLFAVPVRPSRNLARSSLSSLISGRGSRNTSRGG